MLVRTTIVIDNELMNEVLKLGGFKTRQEAVNAGLQLIVRLGLQKKLRKLRGKLPWSGNLSKMRRD